MRKPRIAILGAGPAGLGAAWQLGKQGKAEAVVLEQNSMVGGNAGSFSLAGLNVDYGSHRLHPQCEPRILADLQQLLGEDLLTRPRRGRIRLQKRWIHFPLKLQDLVFKLPPQFGAGVTLDVVKRIAPVRNGNGGDSFTSVLEKGLGETICRDFYFPFAKKIWGLAPSDLSATQARRRVSAGSLGKLTRKILSTVPGLKTPFAGKFFYPRRGFGQISEAIAAAATASGAQIKLNSPVQRLEAGDNRWRITSKGENGDSETFEADYVWSTIPVTVLSKIIQPEASPEVLEASGEINYRAMILIYLVLETERFTEYDAHYFPEIEIKLTRLSEPKNYSATGEQRGRTVICGELPCAVGDEIWRASNEELAEIVKDSLARCGLPVEVPVSEIVTKRLPFAYPIYTKNYERHFEVLDDWSAGLKNFLTFGRQGLFAHDNTHHALAMAYAAVDCLDSNGEFDAARWKDCRAEFAKHVVED